MLTGPVKIFTTSNVPRLNYIADLILNDILGLSWCLITDKRKLGKSVVINYSEESIPGSFKIIPAGLLFETGIRQQEIFVSKWKELPVFFQAPEDCDLPFDIFSATFYLVTRYEEYSEFSADRYGRFCASGSLAYRNGFLNIPVVDLWVREFAKVLVRKYQTLSFKRNEFRSLLTVDVDEPFAFRGKNLFRNLKGIFSDIRTGHGKMNRRIECITGREKDPYQNFDYLSEKIKVHNIESMFFFPVGDASPYEKNPSWKNNEYRVLISGIASDFKAGLHPSVRASLELPKIRSESKRLSSILNRKVYSSRFHYLKIVMPQSYRNILSAGITEDYSMGFHDEPGFRAGIARPFMFYDITGDKPTNLRIFPFQVMDITLKEYKKLIPGEAKKVIGELISATRNAGGIFISIWHNTTLLNTAENCEWREVFDFTLRNQQV